MNFEEYKAKLIRANPNMANPQTRMTISVESFMKQIERAFRSGAGSKEGKKMLPKLSVTLEKPKRIYRICLECLAIKKAMDKYVDYMPTACH